MRTFKLKVIAFVVGFALSFGVTQFAFADSGAPVGSGSALAVGSSGSATVTITVTAAHIDDPIANPVAAFDELVIARRLGWPLLVLTLLVMVTKTIGSSAAVLQQVPVVGAAATWLAQGKRAVLVAGVGALAAAALNVVVNGGTWLAAATAGVVALFAAMHPVVQTKAAA